MFPSKRVLVRGYAIVLNCAYKLLDTESNYVSTVENLWDLATLALAPEEISYINSISPRNQTTLCVLRELRQAAEEKKKLFGAKERVIMRANKPPIVVLEQIDKILGSVERFIQIGDCAVQYDPTHAALPWACIKFFLQVRLQYPQEGVIYR